MRNAFAASCLAFGLGIGAGDAGVPRAVAGLAGFGIALAALLVGRRRSGVWLWAAILVSFCAGCLRITGIYALAEPMPRYTERRHFEARVEGRADFDARVRLRLAEVVARDDGRRLPGGLELWLDAPLGSRPAPDVGDRIRVRARVDPLQERRNPGERDRAAWQRRAGIGGQASGGPEAWVRLAPAPARRGGGWQRIRRDIAQRLGEGPDRGLIRALGIGDAAALGPETRARFSALGLSHLLAVSGLHLAWVGLALCIGLAQLGRMVVPLAARYDVRPMAQLLALVGVAGYAALTGFGLPVRRALVLVAAATLAARAARPAPRGQALWLAAGAILLLEPGALFAPGAQLSFAACAALAAHAGRGLVGPAPVALRALEASAVATAATAPLAALHWGVSAPFALLANAVAIPWVSVALLPASLATCVALAWDAPGSAGLLQLATALAWATRSVLEAIAGALPARPMAPMSGSAWLAGTALAGFALVVPGRSLRIVLVCAMGLVFALAPVPRTGELPRLVALDVGRGDAILVQSEQAAILVDGGTALAGRFDLGAQRVVPALHALGVTKLDLVIATHADLDHRGGLPAVLEALPVATLWMPWGAREDPDFEPLRATAARRGVPSFERGLGDSAERFRDLRVRPVWPSARALEASRNEASLGVRVDVAGRRILLLGDVGLAETQLLRAVSAPSLASDVLVLPHHGSRRSASRALLRRVDAGVHIVSAPCPAKRGLPHPESLARANETGTPLWWTGRDGAVFVELRRLTVSGFRPRAGQSSSCSTSRS